MRGEGPLIETKRIYDPPEEQDGYRVLVDRLWPRGVSKEDAALDRWMRELAPSDELRAWFGHDPSKWDEFRDRYGRELEERKEEINFILDKSRQGTVTLLYAARDTERNNAVALEQYLSARGDE